jgi:thiamine-monophosphate kinase
VTVADLGEFGLISAIRAMLPPDPAGILGPGDDGAVLPAPDGRVVASTDLLIEGRHFRRDWSSGADVGTKAAAQNLADIAAMGAIPTALLFGLAIPGELSVAWVLDVTRGMAAECQRGGAVIAGGDITSADQIMLAITALGDLAGRPAVTRAGASPGEVIALSAPAGWSAAGLALLTAGLAGQPAEPPPELAAHRRPQRDATARLPPDLAGLVAAHRRPQPDYAAGPAAAVAGATAMIDISDGLVADLGHIAESSGARLSVSTARLPGTAPLATAAERLGTDWRPWALGGGEDHCLAAAFPARKDVPPGWTVIGDVSAGAGVLVDSRPFEGPPGWDHFRKGRD